MLLYVHRNRRLVRVGERAHSPPVAFISKVRSSDVQDQNQHWPQRVTTSTSPRVTTSTGPRESRPALPPESHDQHWPRGVKTSTGPRGVKTSTGPRETGTLAALAPGSHERLQHWLQGVTNACSTGPRESRTFAALAPGSHERLQRWPQGVTNACSIAMGHQRGTAADSRLHQHRPAGRLRAILQRKPTAAFPYYLQ